MGSAWSVILGGRVFIKARYIAPPRISTEFESSKNSAGRSSKKSNHAYLRALRTSFLEKLDRAKNMTLCPPGTKCSAIVVSLAKDVQQSLSGIVAEICGSFYNQSAEWADRWVFFSRQFEAVRPPTRLPSPAAVAAAVPWRSYRHPLAVRMPSPGDGCRASSHRRPRRDILNGHAWVDLARRSLQ